MAKPKFSLKKSFLSAIYDPRINQGMWLSLATGFLYLLFYLMGHKELAFLSIIAILPALMAGVDRPGPRQTLRLTKIILLFFISSSLVLILSRAGIPLALIFFPLIFIFAMFAAYGNESGRLGTAAMLVSTLSLSCPPSTHFLVFPLFISLGTLWYGTCARVWMVWWGHRVLRDTLARLFVAIGKYYTLKARLLREQGDKETFATIYRLQEDVYDLINQSKIYLNRYSTAGYNNELTKLEQNFFFAVDLMELLQSNQYKLEEMRDFINSSHFGSMYSQVALAVVAGLQEKAIAIRTRREITIQTGISFTSFEEALLNSKEVESPFIHSLRLHLKSLRRLLTSQQPAFRRIIGAPAENEGIKATISPHFSFKSPVFRYALRLAVTFSSGILLAESLNLNKSYWLLLTILLVMQSGYLLTKTMIGQRVIGTLAGVLLGLVLIQLPTDGKLVLLIITLGIALFSLSMIFQHKIWSITGVTALVILGYEFAFSNGEEMLYTRLLDSLLGCCLAFASNILLWPQWNGGGIKRLIKETLLAQEDLLIFSIRALSDRNIKFEQLTRRRLKLYTAQNNLLASYQQMLREPQHTREYVNSLDQVLGHFVATAAHINALLPMSREITPMPPQLTEHMERAIIAIYSRCGEKFIHEPIDLLDELKIVYNMLEQIKENADDPQHFAIIHLLEIIYERLDAIFGILDFCDSERALNPFLILGFS
jgi:uncharacterized membrane protein YccC